MTKIFKCERCAREYRVGLFTKKESSVTMVTLSDPRNPINPNKVRYNFLICDSCVADLLRWTWEGSRPPKFGDEPDTIITVREGGENV